MAAEHIKRAQTLLGVEVDGNFGPETLAAFERAIVPLTRDTIPTGSSLEDRATAWCEKEAAFWGDTPVPRHRVAEYFEFCEQNESRQKGIDLARMTRAGQDLSFCAAAQGFAEHAVSLSTDRPVCRAGAKEYLADAQRGLRGPWVPLEAVRSGKVIPPPRGSLAIYDRPSTPQEWDGHVRRVCSSNAHGYLGVGANEGKRQWKRDTVARPWSDPHLLGFVYPRGAHV